MKTVLLAALVVAALAAGVVAGAVLTTGESPATANFAADHTPGKKHGKVDSKKDADDKGPAKAAKHAAQRAFVEAKQAWAACVAEAAPEQESAEEAFDPEAACGTKPRNPMAADKSHKHDEHDKGKCKGRAVGKQRG